MNGSVPFAPFAHVGASSGVGHRPHVPISGMDAHPLKNGFLIHSGSFTARRDNFKLTRATFAVVVLLTVTAAMGFLIIQCFRALTSGRSTENHGETSRNLAEKGGTSCSVSHRVERTGQTVVWRALRLSIAAFGRFALSLGVTLRVSHDAKESSE